MAHSYIYPATIEPSGEGTFLVAFPDLPEALTEGDDLTDALAQAEDCLEEAIAYRITVKKDIPAPSRLAAGQHLISVPPRMALKAALYQAFAESGLSGVAAAEKTGLSDTQFRRLLAPRHRSDVAKLHEALAALGKSVQIRVVNSRAA